MSFEQFGWISYTSQTRISKFIDYLRQGKIYGTKCNECGFLQFPPRAHCARCFSTNFEWNQLSGDCKLVTYTKVEAAPSMFQDQAPYVVALAESNEGPKVLAWLDKTISEHEISVGMKLVLTPISLPNDRLSYVLSKPNQSRKEPGPRASNVGREQDSSKMLHRVSMSSAVSAASRQVFIV
jgi:uncharacterized OB-fold protein